MGVPFVVPQVPHDVASGTDARGAVDVARPGGSQQSLAVLTEQGVAVALPSTVGGAAGSHTHSPADTYDSGGEK